MTGRGATIRLIRERRAMGITTRRRRLSRQQQPDGIRLEYYKAIKWYVDRAHSLIVASLYPVLPAMIENAKAIRGDSVTRMDIHGRRAQQIIDKAAKDLAEQMKPTDLEAIAASFGKKTSKFQKEQLNRQVREVLGVDLAAIEPEIQPRIVDFTAENVSLIKSVPSRYFDDVEKRVTSAVRSGQRWQDLAKDLEKRYDVSKSQAKLIARDQVGKFFGELNKARQEALGVDTYIWQTVNDNRVREEHEERQGQTFRWDDPPDDGPPGMPINCRCYAEPDLASVLRNL
jgi:SPP1 gp7 family putative phage head morphogenesis protein